MPSSLFKNIYLKCWCCWPEDCFLEIENHILISGFFFCAIEHNLAQLLFHFKFKMSMPTFRTKFLVEKETGK